MRTLRRTTTTAALALAALLTLPGAASADSGDQPTYLPPLGSYFAPTGNAVVTWSKELQSALKANNARVETIAPVSRMKSKDGSDTGIWMPIGFKYDSLDVTQGRVYYSGGFKIIRDATHDSMECNGFWLKVNPSGVWCNLKVNDEPWKEVKMGYFNLAQFPFSLIAPKGPGIGPTIWPFYLDDDITPAIDELGISGLTKGTPIFNLDATISVFDAYGTPPTGSEPGRPNPYQALHGKTKR
ncbi:hypothetical protein [Streptomyces sp. NBC_01465]|uniref:hypothetical protein n=1 Tax=Streptomyces sp. NBC_01465 TaxID=2903878 RepID=UPI002E351256|nr:hypothetical protein [Streptomyces sp. NBC_01465]